MSVNPNAARCPADSLVGNIGGANHLKAIATQLRGIQQDFAYVLNLLKSPDWSVWDDHAEEASMRLARAVVMLRGALDAIAVLDNNTRPEKERVAFHKVSFWTTDLSLAGARSWQVYLRNKASRKREDDSFYLDFDRLVGFWEHYYPRPQPQDHLPRRDFFLGVRFFTNGVEHKGASGPVMHDLLLPALRAATGLVLLYAQRFDVHGMPEAFDDDY
jgi:hypothetical protein